MAYSQLRLFGLIDQQSLVRCLSPELMLVDPELAQRARELLHDPAETNGKGNMSTLLGTHEISSGIGFGLEPPLSPPVVHGPSAMTTAGPSAHMDLPTPPPALRPPESSMAPGPAPTPEPAPTPPAAPEIPVQQVQPVQPAQAPAPPPPPPPAPVQQEQEPLMAPPPLEPVAPQVDPAPVELMPVAPPSEPEPEIAAVAPAQVEPELPAMSPEPEVSAHEHVEVPAPPAEPVEAPAAPEIQVLATPAPVEAPTAPVEEARIELPSVGSIDAPTPELAATPEPVAEPVFEFPVVAPQAGAFRVVVRLTDGDGVEVGEFRDFGTAMQGAQEVIDQFSHSNGSWPFYAGRFSRRDLIVSVDVVDASAV